MKRLKTILLFLVICISCFGQNRTRTNTSTNTNNTTSQRVIWWEYEIVKVKKQYQYNDDFHAPEFLDQTDMLNLMGIEGWELVSVYTEIATAFPNFSNSDYVAGINSNTRTQVINFVFKRPKSEK